MSPEFLATIQTGAVVRVVKGGAPLGAKVRRAWTEHHVGYSTFCVEVDDGIAGEREVILEGVTDLG